MYQNCNCLISIRDKVIGYLENIEISDKDCIIFDIDNTLLDDNGRTILPIKNIYDYVKFKNITVFLVTNRIGNEYNILYTQNQLNMNGINGYSSIYFNIEQNFGRPYEYKNKARKNIYNRGYKTIMSLGDQIWDVHGEHTGVGILIPI